MVSEFDSEVDFFRFLNRWNQQGKGFYLYTAIDHPPKGHAAHDFKSTQIVTPAKRDPNEVYKAGGWWTSLQKAVGAVPTVSRKS
jgi:hypothetical protein